MTIIAFGWLKVLLEFLYLWQIIMGQNVSHSRKQKPSDCDLISSY